MPWKLLGSVHRWQNAGVDAARWNGGGVSKVDDIPVGQMYPLATSLQGCVWSPGQLQPRVALSPPRALPGLGQAAEAGNRAATGGKPLPGAGQEKSSQLPLKLLGSHVWPRPHAA